MRGKKFVLDTNIWLSYIITAQFKKLAQIIFDNNLQVYISADIARELSYNLRKEKIKKYLSLPASYYLSEIRTSTIIIKPLKVFNESPDPTDNFLFDLTIKAKADYLVTGDKLLFQTKIEALRIITLKEFKMMFEK